MNLQAARQLMCEIGHRIWLRGYCAGNEGNHSVRIGKDRVLCTPTGLSKGFLKPNMICVVDMDGEQVDRRNAFKRTSEVLMHLAIYKARPDVGAVVHSHSPHATAFAIANIPVPEGIHPEAEVFLGKVRTARYATPGDTRLGQTVLDVMESDTNTVLLNNHGSVVFDTTLQGAYDKLEILEAYCRVLMLAAQFGRVNVLEGKEMAGLLALKERFGMGDTRRGNLGKVGEDNGEFFKTLKKRG